MHDAHYKTLYGIESLGDGALKRVGVRVMVHVDDPTLLDNEDVRHAGSKAVDAVLLALRLEAKRRDPMTEVQRLTEKEAFTAAFIAAGFPVIYMEPVENEYWRSGPEAMESPWYVVTTPIGHFKVGWRKRVIVLDWTRTTIKTPASTVFHTEDVTMGDCMIHCWGYDKLHQYLRMLVTHQTVPDGTVSEAR